MVLDSIKTEDGYPLDSTQKHYYVSNRVVYESTAPTIHVASNEVGFGDYRGTPDAKTGRVPGLYRKPSAAWAAVAQGYIDEAKKAMSVSADFSAKGE